MNTKLAEFTDSSLQNGNRVKNIWQNLINLLIYFYLLICLLIYIFCAFIRRYINILAWLQGFRVKLQIFQVSFVPQFTKYRSLSHVRILIYRTKPIGTNKLCMHVIHHYSAYGCDMGCFPLCQTDLSDIGGNTRPKWNNIFRLNRRNQ